MFIRGSGLGIEKGKILEENIPSNFFKNPKTHRSKKFLDQVLNH